MWSALIRISAVTTELMIYSFNGAFRCTQFEPATCHFRLFHGIETNVNVGFGVSEGCFSFRQLCFLSTFNAVGGI